MSQPIRKDIKEKIGEPEKKIYTLLIDGNNLLRQAMVDTKVNGNGIHYGGIFQFLLQIRMLLTGDYQYDYVYVVFDDSDSGILRYEIYNQYKANRDKRYSDMVPSNEEESEYWRRLNKQIKSMERAIYGKKKGKGGKEEIVDENFERERNIIMMYCVDLSIRVLFDRRTEGDDFIAYYVKHKVPEERIVIVTTDNDLTQLISPTVAVYNRMLKKYLTFKNFKREKGFPIENVILKKILLGDTSDNIGKIRGLSEQRLMELMPEISQRPVTIDEVKARAKEAIDKRIEEKKKPLQWQENIVNGVSNTEYDGDFYEINNKLINLSEPLLTQSAIDSIESMMYAPMEPDDKAFSHLYKAIRKDGIENLMDSSTFSSFFAPFKELSDRENRRYQKYLEED